MATVDSFPVEEAPSVGMHAAPVSRPRLDGLSRKAAQSQPAAGGGGERCATAPTGAEKWHCAQRA
ncbi:hypothetical protein DN501_04010 [Burkholderia multivorans]|nr:hypothetical protein DN501_04010 [Burkholderia multivorans]